MAKQSQLIPHEVIASLPFWRELDGRQQAQVRDETHALAAALVQHGFSRLAVGEHLTRLRDLLEPQRFFLKYLKNFHFSQRTAYRYIQGYENARRRLPEAVLRAAMARGYAMVGDSKDRPLGVYTEAVKRLPPPKTENPDRINAYLDEVERVQKKARSQSVRKRMAEVEREPEVMLKECFRFFVSRFRHLPKDNRIQTKWVADFVGMLMTEAGLSTAIIMEAKSFAPVPIPDGFRAVRGRPRKPKVASAAE